MISNPCSWFATGGSREDERQFTYEGGTHLYHFDCSGDKPDAIRTGWTGNWIPVNVIFFANSVEHARDVFKRMLEFRLETLVQNMQYYKGNITAAEHFLAIADSWYRRCKEWLTRIDEAVFTLAPTNQFFKVNWACNDLILR